MSRFEPRYGRNYMKPINVAGGIAFAPIPLVSFTDNIALFLDISGMNVQAVSGNISVPAANMIFFIDDTSPASGVFKLSLRYNGTAGAVNVYVKKGLSYWVWATTNKAIDLYTVNASSISLVPNAFFFSMGDADYIDTTTEYCYFAFLYVRIVK